MRTTTALIIPTRNSMPYLDEMMAALETQTLVPDEILIVDTASTDGSAERWATWGARVANIPVKEFNHGGTRKKASRLVTSDVLIYMTQDAIPADNNALLHLKDALVSAHDIGMAYGRQLPSLNAGLLARQSRIFNYPAQSRTKRISDAPELGIKTCFSSNAFCAYRRDALEAVGGFPENVIGTEDAHVAGRMLLANYAVRYEAEACVRHSHEYSIFDEFRRYFDIGVFYGREQWIRRSFGKARDDGRRYVTAEVRAVLANEWWRLPEVAVRTVPLCHSSCRLH
ncbi:MAG: glycosyltransferase family 2 protein [Acidiferrobacteraceae bacterium]